MRELDLTEDLSPRHAEVMRALGLLGTTVGTDSWCVVGGLMVLIAARSTGQRLPRAEQTKDGDIVVDVCADREAIVRVSNALRRFGYEPPTEPWPGEDFARCTFTSGRAQVDVLCPDDADHGDLDTEDGIRSLAIPGGRRALELSEPVSIRYHDDSFDVQLRVPLFPGAVIVKTAAALDPRTMNQPRHIQDVVSLFAIIEDPPRLRTLVDTNDVEMLRGLANRINDPADVAWDGIEGVARERAIAAFDLLTR